VSAERQAQIIQAALACFSRKGYAKTTMDDIVAESGLSKGSLYWYFESKDDLFMSALASVIADVGDTTFGTIDQHASPTERLRALGVGMATFCRAAAGYLGLFAEFWAQTEHRDEAARLWAGMLTVYRDALTEIIAEGVSSGEFRAVDADHLTWSMLAAYDGIAFYLMLIPDLDPDAVSAAFVDALINGLRADQ